MELFYVQSGTRKLKEFNYYYYKIKKISSYYTHLCSSTTLGTLLSFNIIFFFNDDVAILIKSSSHPRRGGAYTSPPYLTTHHNRPACLPCSTKSRIVCRYIGYCCICINLSTQYPYSKRLFGDNLVERKMKEIL